MVPHEVWFHTKKNLHERRSALSGITVAMLVLAGILFGPVILAYIVAELDDFL